MERKLSENSLVVTVRALLTTMMHYSQSLLLVKVIGCLTRYHCSVLLPNTSLFQHVPSASKFLDVVVLLVSFFLSF